MSGLSLSLSLSRVRTIYIESVFFSSGKATSAALECALGTSRSSGRGEWSQASLPFSTDFYLKQTGYLAVENEQLELEEKEEEEADDPDELTEREPKWKASLSNSSSRDETLYDPKGRVCVCAFPSFSHPFFSPFVRRSAPD